MRIRIVCYEDVDAWILGKFALKMHENLKLMGIESDIAKTPDLTADINHHIIYIDYNGSKSTIDTLMVTHIDNIEKKNQLSGQLNSAEMGICMSRESVNILTTLGLPRGKICYVNPAHDGIIVPRKLIIGITCRVQEDGRKREFFLNKLAHDISPSQFAFKIMGDGWNTQVEYLRKKGYSVDYTNHFIYDEYIKLIPALDFYLYMGQDEGQMGFIDALAAGVETIVTPQGYHLDAQDGISYPFNTYEELRDILQSIAAKREKLFNSVSTWNWSDYTKKHVEIWEYLIAKKNNKSFSPPVRNYNDGIFSVAEYDNFIIEKKNPFFLKVKLTKELVSQKYYSNRYNMINYYNRNGLKAVIIKLFKKIFLLPFRKQNR